MPLTREQVIYKYGDSIKEILLSRVTNITRLLPGPYSIASNDLAYY
jgi:hypothetical protein